MISNSEMPMILFIGVEERKKLQRLYMTQSFKTTLVCPYYDHI